MGAVGMEVEPMGGVTMEEEDMVVTVVVEVEMEEVAMVRE